MSRMVKLKDYLAGDRAALEAMSNEYLKENCILGEESGIYTEEQIKRLDRDRGEVSIEQAFDESVVSIPVVDALLDCLWIEILAGAKKKGCSQRQIDFLELRCLGNTYQEIADATYVTWECKEDTVRLDLKTAAKLIQDIPEFGIWSLLSEVFRMPISKIKQLL